VKEAKGNPGRRKKAKASIILGESKNHAPKELSSKARQIWGLLAPELNTLRFLRDTDKMAFARYCEHVAKWWELTKDLETNGFSAITESNHVTMERLRPAFIVRERIEKRLETLEDRFGLNPAARQQILQRLAGLVPQPTGDLFGQQESEHDDKPSPEPRPPSAIGLLRQPETITKH
jgi:P27 family predicted phage terminase small subunit